MHTSVVGLLLPLFTPSSSMITTTNPNLRTSSFGERYNNSLICRASSSSSSSASSIRDLDLYDLLGIDSSSDQSQIKVAYRALQKRCHPDIAGPAGHDMAIILNQAYSLLSDPNSRFLYDKEQSKMAELRGYTGKPMYSVWLGGESEERAVFVDEVKCVGCLKCALLADKTFAIESVYGRARVVAQWADPEHKIQEAIEACPVDCISMVERSNLAALEFLMSKQPRGNVRIGAGNTAGARVSNIFVDVQKFQTRFQEAMAKGNKASSANQHSQGAEEQTDARMSAIQAIRSISNWLYWHSPGDQSSHKLALIARKSPSEPNIDKLRDAAAAIKQNSTSTRKIPSNYTHNDEYWIPSQLVLPESTTDGDTGSRSASKPPSHTRGSNRADDRNSAPGKKNTQRSPFVLGAPMVTATIAAVFVKFNLGGVGGGRLQEHWGGSLALDIVNSSWSQVVLAGITWYLIGMYVVELIEALWGKLKRN